MKNFFPFFVTVFLYTRPIFASIYARIFDKKSKILRSHSFRWTLWCVIWPRLPISFLSNAGYNFYWGYHPGCLYQGLKKYFEVSLTISWRVLLVGSPYCLHDFDRSSEIPSPDWEIRRSHLGTFLYRNKRKRYRHKRYSRGGSLLYEYIQRAWSSYFNNAYLGGDELWGNFTNNWRICLKC